MQNAVQKAVAIAKSTSLADPKRTSKEIALIRTQIEGGNAALKALFGIEEFARDTLQKRLEELKARQVQFQNGFFLGTRYHALSLEPFTWRDEQGWPTLVFFSLESPKFEFAARGSRDWNGHYRYRAASHPKLPKVIAACYADVLAKLRTLASSKSRTVKLVCNFNGLIPAAVKEKITEAKSLFEEIFIVAEPSGFNLEEAAIVMPKRDPLVVGFDGNGLWLIADFETTSVEEAAFFYPVKS